MVVGSPKTLSSDGVWRAWIRWVRDHGAFLTANALPLCPWESPDDNFVCELDVSDLAPLRDSDAGRKRAPFAPMPMLTHTQLTLHAPSKTRTPAWLLEQRHCRMQ